MLLPQRFLPGDEELGKRDDDHKPGQKSPLANVLMHSRLPQRRNVKRLGILVVVLVGFYFFFKNMPTDANSGIRRPSYTHESKDAVSSWNKGNTQAHRGSSGSKPSAKAPQEAGAEKRWFNGAIKFYNLAATLHAIARNGGGNWANKNVLFAASSLKSASALLPMACEMSILRRNNVHFALLGRDDISLDTLKEVNGVQKGCDISYHDARPDYSLQSTDYRMEVSCGAALNHISNFMHPHSVIVDGSSAEDQFFLTGIRKKAIALGTTLIELPKNAEQNLMWITRLDSNSLSAWNKVSISILIHAQPAASGSLLRLLSSLSKADYFSSTPPALTIELPEEIDGPTQSRLQNFKWPPASHGHVEGNANRLTLRHRIPQHSLTLEESSTRFLESFWPANPATSHVLVLAPQVEVSPLFFHYLKYTLLEYKYGFQSGDEHGLMGISLDLPSTYLNDSTNFFPPFLKESTGLEIEATSPFLWQAPNSNAALYFGDHWIEIHSFISKSLASKQELPSTKLPTKKLVSKTYPSWLEHVLALSRTRGYTLLYPNLANQTSLATVHNELYHPPEEFTPKSDDQADKYTDSDEDWVVDASHLSLQHEEMPLARTSLLNVLPSDSILPELSLVPRLTFDGKQMSGLYEMSKLAENYAETFRQELGGCSLGSEVKKKKFGRADDLFCYDQKKDVYSASVEQVKKKPVTLDTPETTNPLSSLGVSSQPHNKPATHEPLKTAPAPATAPETGKEKAPKAHSEHVESKEPVAAADGTQVHPAPQADKAPNTHIPPVEVKQPVVAAGEAKSYLPPTEAKQPAAAIGDVPKKPAQIVEDTVKLPVKVTDSLGNHPVEPPVVAAGDTAVPKKPAQIVEDTVKLPVKVTDSLGNHPVEPPVVAAGDTAVPKKPAQIVEDATSLGKKAVKPEGIGADDLSLGNEVQHKLDTAPAQIPEDTTELQRKVSKKVDGKSASIVEDIVRNKPQIKVGKEGKEGKHEV